MSGTLAILPVRVREFLNLREALNQPELGINVLTPAGCLDYHNAVNWGPAERRLCLLPLDDANDSNPFCYVCYGPAAGMVLHLRHDDDVVLAFSDLSAFAAALRNLAARDDGIWDIAYQRPLAAPDPAAVRVEIAKLIKDPDDGENMFLVLLYLPLLPLTPDILIEQLVESENLAVREAIAEAFAASPTAQCRHLIEQLAADVVAQVARPARRALAVLRAGAAR